tara:strand:- start:3720 stop:3884 length:165 start_codon:yes stop_codon:yes gene_type:complete
MKNKLLRVLILFLAFIGLFFVSDQVFLMNDEEYDPFTPINQITEDDGVDFPIDI